MHASFLVTAALLEGTGVEKASICFPQHLQNEILSAFVDETLRRGDYRNSVSHFPASFYGFFAVSRRLVCVVGKIRPAEGGVRHERTG